MSDTLQLLAAIAEAKKKYPWLNRMKAPIKLTKGKGPFMSESYDPSSEDNPSPGNFTVQMRDPKLLQDPSKWAALLGREGLDYEARHDPTYQKGAMEFWKSMTPQQYQTSAAAQLQDKDPRSFPDFMRSAELQEWIGGNMLNMPQWGNEKFTPQQLDLLKRLKAALSQ